MQEITRWVADDGKEFEFEEDCEDYECRCIFEEFYGNPNVKFFNSQKERMEFRSWNDFCERANEIVYFTSCETLDSFLCTDVNGTEIGERADFPMYGEWWGKNDDVIMWDDGNDEWVNLSIRFKDLHKTLKKIAES